MKKAYKGCNGTSCVLRDSGSEVVTKYMRRSGREASAQDCGPHVLFL